MAGTLVVALPDGVRGSLDVTVTAFDTAGVRVLIKNLLEGFAAVARAICDKMLRRHPHVFGDVTADDSATVLLNWETMKAEERRAETDQARDPKRPRAESREHVESVPREAPERVSRAARGPRRRCASRSRGRGARSSTPRAISRRTERLVTFRRWAND